MHLELAEAAGERDVLLGGELLVAEEQHLVVDPGTGELFEHVVGERLRQVEALDDATERGADLADLEVLPLEGGQPDAFGGQVGDRADDRLVGTEGELAGVELAEIAGRLDPLQLGDRRVRGLQVVVGDAHLVPAVLGPVSGGAGRRRADTVLPSDPSPIIAAPYRRRTWLYVSTSPTNTCTNSAPSRTSTRACTSTASTPCRASAAGSAWATEPTRAPPR